MLTWAFFKNYLFSKRSGSLMRIIAKICITGIALGILSFITILSIMNGFHDSIENRYLKLEPHIVIQKKLSELNELNKIPFFKSAQGYESQDIFIKTVDGLYSGGIAKAYNRKDLIKKFLKLAPPKIKNETKVVDSIKIQNFGDDALTLSPQTRKTEDIKNIIKSLKPDEVLVGSVLAYSLGILEGDTLTILPPESLLLPPGEVPTYKKVTVKYIFNSEVPEYDTSYIFYEKNTGLLNQFKKTATFTEGTEITLTDPNQFTPAKDHLVAQKNLTLSQVDSWMDRNSILFFALKVEKFTIGTFLSLSGVIAGLSIITILYLLMTQKKQDIGILLTMGMSPARTKRLFTGLGFFLSGIGILIGIVVGITISLLLQHFPIPILPDFYFDRTIPAQLDLSLVFFVLFFSVILSFLTSYIPAHFLVKYTPVEALKK